MTSDVISVWSQWCHSPATSSVVLLCYSDRRGSVLCSVDSSSVVCSSGAVSPPSCVLFPKTSEDGDGPGLFLVWSIGLTRGTTGWDSVGAGIVADTEELWSSFSGVWSDAGKVLDFSMVCVGLMSWHRDSGASPSSLVLAVVPLHFPVFISPWWTEQSLSLAAPVSLTEWVKRKHEWTRLN